MLLHLQRTVGNRAVAGLLTAPLSDARPTEVATAPQRAPGASARVPAGTDARARGVLQSPDGPAPRARAAIGPAVQRAMKFEFQTRNRILRRRGRGPARPLDRKYGPYDHLVKGSTGVRLESETRGVLEFETDWYRKWSALKKRIEEAVAMTQAINAARDLGGGRRRFPFDVGHLRAGTRAEKERGKWFPKRGHEGKNERILQPGEHLEVDVIDPAWRAGIQSSESFQLDQYESFLTQHEWPDYSGPAVTAVAAILQRVARNTPPAEIANLRNLLLIIVNYTMRAQGGEKSDRTGAFASVKGMPAKQAFTLMSRTNFASMYRTLLRPKEQRLFRRIVKRDEVLNELGINRRTRVFAEGYGKPARKGPTVYSWMYAMSRGRDLLAAGTGPGLSGAMGRFSIDERKGRKHSGLVRFETRNTTMGAFKDAKDWVDYARTLFIFAATFRSRKRGKGQTGLEAR